MELIAGNRPDHLNQRQPSLPPNDGGGSTRGVAVTTIVTHLSADATSTAFTMVTVATAFYTITLAVIALTAVYARTTERRHAAHKTLAILVRHCKSSRVRRHR
jgi:hypothetical protein